LIKGYTKIYGKNTDVEDIVGQIMDFIDSDGSGDIDCTEWIYATVDKNMLLKPKKIQAVFEAIDQDKSGDISQEEILRVLFANKSIEYEVFEEIMKEVKVDIDKPIDIIEFSQIMEQFLSVRFDTRFHRKAQKKFNKKTMKLS